MENSSWHHTGAFYNKTDFYKLKEDALMGISENDIQEIINKRPKRKTLKAEEKNEKKEEQAAKEKIREKDSGKVEQWKQLPEGNRRYKDVEIFENDIETYIKENYLNKIEKKSKTLGIIRNNIDANLKDKMKEKGLNIVEYEADDEADRIENVNSVPDIYFSLKNKNITADTLIPVVQNTSYIKVTKGDIKALSKLQNKVKNLKRGTYENKATGYKADINSTTIMKITNPAQKFNHWSRKYINNLNAAIYLPEIFENDIYMNNDVYRVRIVAREKVNSDTLYIVEAEILATKNEAGQAAGQKTSYFSPTPFEFSVPDLVNGVKIYNYNTQNFNT